MNNNGSPSIFFLIMLFGLLVSTAGCSSLQTQSSDTPGDPFEGFNRSIYSFNEGVDRTVLKPLATGYRDTLPRPVRTSISNFFKNLAYPTVVINDVLQGKFLQALSDAGRFITNSTLGVLGLFDVATRLDMPAHKEDFGQTFGVWGIADGPYLVLPLIGPSNPRDAIGLLFDSQTDLLNYYQDDAPRIALQVLEIVDDRADLLSAGRIFDEAALDPYSFRREAYLQRRLNQIHDGNAPQQRFSEGLEDSLDEEDDLEDSSAPQP